MERVVVKHLEEKGISLKIRNDKIDIKQMAEISFKRDMINDSKV